MKLEKDFWLKLFFESLLIVFSVLLALALNEYLSARKEEKKTRQVLVSIREELQTNMEIIEAWQKIHQEALKNIEYHRSQPSFHDSLVQRNQFRFDLLFKGTLIPSTVRSNAWEIAKNTGLIQNFDLALANMLSDIYDMQRIGVITTADKLIALIYERQTHQQENVPQTLVIFEITMKELVGQETYLLKTYGDILKQLERELHE